jgi:chromosome segregation ATPase
MTVARALYGVTLEDSGVSRVVSVRLRAGEVIAITGTA